MGRQRLFIQDLVQVSMGQLTSILEVKMRRRGTGKDIEKKEGKGNSVLVVFGFIPIGQL